MTDLHARFGPRTDEEELVFAVEGLLADVQLAIHEAMHTAGITKSELANRLGCSPANVTQLLSEEANLKVRTVARIFHVLGMACEFRSHPRTRTGIADDAWRQARAISDEKRDDIVPRYISTDGIQAHNNNRRLAIAA